MRKLSSALLLGLITLAFAADGQSFYSVRRDRQLIASIGSGISRYHGDMADPRELNKIRPNVVFGAEYYLTNQISVRGNLSWFQLAGDDRNANDDRVERNLHFRSNCTELNVAGVFNVLPNGTRYYQRPRVNAHVFAGVGFLRHNPKAKYLDKWYALQPLETENIKYSRWQFVIPFGMGVRFKVNPFINVMIEGTYRKTFTDYLDDVSSTRYPDASLLKSDLSRALSDRRPEIGTQPSQPTLRGKRGNPANDDGYFLGNIVVQYYLPKVKLFDNQRKLYKSKRRSIFRRKK